MSKPGYTPMSPLSAAMTLAIWHEQHGRWPRYTECTGANGLRWHTTYLKAFEVLHWPEMLERAQALCSQPLSVLYSMLPASVVPKLKPCANKPECSSLILDEGPAIRYCAPCKRGWRDDQVPYALGFLDVPSGPERRARWGIGCSDWDGKGMAL